VAPRGGVPPGAALAAGAERAVARFDARDPGTDPAEWADDAGRAAALPGLDPASFDAVVVLAAHADDETLGVGGLLARAARAGVPSTLVVVSDGGASHPGDPRPGALAEERAAEARAAAAVLGVGTTLQLHHPDGGLREARVELAAELGALLDELLGPPGAERGRTLVLTTWRGDGHRDHRVLGEVTVEVVRGRAVTLREYPVWLWHWGRPDHPEVPWDHLERVDLAPADQESRRRALDAYPSQTTARHGEPPVLHAGFLAHARRGHDLVVRP